MSEVTKIASTLGTSEPVFKISKDRNGDLDFELKNKYRVPDEADPLYTLLQGFYDEYLNVQNGRFEARACEDVVHRAIVDAMRRLVRYASPLKNPKQSKLYKWLSGRHSYAEPSAVGFIALYRYAVNNGICDSEDCNDPRVRNTLAVLELMRKKYEDQGR